MALPGIDAGKTMVVCLQGPVFHLYFTGGILKIQGFVTLSETGSSDLLHVSVRKHIGLPFYY